LLALKVGLAGHGIRNLFSRSTVYTDLSDDHTSVYKTQEATDLRSDVLLYTNCVSRKYC
jgi:hypothetical protein